MHVTERERFILALLKQRDFISFKDMEKLMDSSPATIRRDLNRLAQEGKLLRLRGGVQRIGIESEQKENFLDLQGTPFDENVNMHIKEKRAIGKLAASLCTPGEAIVLDGGSTTLQICPHLDGLNMQVMTNSLHIVNALLPQKDTHILVSGGAVFREQNIILTASGDDCMPPFHAPKLFMGAESIGKQGLLQKDMVLVEAERRLIDRADEVIIMVDSSKFSGHSGNIVCPLNNINTIITDSGISKQHKDMIEATGIHLMIAKTS